MLAPRTLLSGKLYIKRLQSEVILTYNPVADDKHHFIIPDSVRSRRTSYANSLGHIQIRLFRKNNMDLSLVCMILWQKQRRSKPCPRHAIDYISNNASLTTDERLSAVWFLVGYWRNWSLKVRGSYVIFSHHIHVCRDYVQSCMCRSISLCVYVYKICMHL